MAEAPVLTGLFEDRASAKRAYRGAVDHKHWRDANGEAVYRR